MLKWLKNIAAKRPTHEDVARLLIARMQQLRPDMSFRYMPQDNTIRFTNGVVGLANLFTDYSRTEPHGRQAVLEAFAQGILPPDIPSDFSAARPHLMPALRHIPGLDLAILAAGLDLDAHAKMQSTGMPLTAAIGVHVVYDSEFGIQSIAQDQFDAWGVTHEQAYEMALDNLRAKSPPAFETLIPGLYRSTYGDCYDAARVLLPEHIYQLGLAGRPVVMIPNRSCLLVASERDERALVGMVKLAAHWLTNESRPLAAEMLRHEDGHWRPWSKPPGVAEGMLRELHQHHTALNYEEQKSALDEWTQQRELDVFVASHTLMQKDDGTAFSFRVLSKGVHTWLPKTDIVMLLDPTLGGTPPRPIAWEVFERETGAMLKRLPYQLDRFEVTTYPDEEAIQRMEQAHI